MEKFIVAEISKNWIFGNSTDGKENIGHQFTLIINHNYERGYTLKDWKHTVTLYEGMMNETIIAIFEKLDA